MRYLILLVAVAVLASCTEPNKSREALRKAGYSEIVLGGYAWFSCSSDDTFATKFTATNPVGERVSGTVCAGAFFKGATIRF